VSKARLVITAVVVEGRSQAEVARSYGVSKGWVSKLVARYRREGEPAFEPRSRGPKTSPNATSDDVVGLIVGLRHQLISQGLDAGAEVTPRRGSVANLRAAASRQLAELDSARPIRVARRADHRRARSPTSLRMSRLS
jgi:transposase-like protein